MNKLSAKELAQLTALGERLEKDRRYMAWVLSSYQRQERLSRAKLEEKFQISHESVIKLALCLCPESDSSNFREQVRQISTYCNIDSSIITSIVRHVETLQALSSQPTSNLDSKYSAKNFGIFSAARDNEEIDNDSSSTDEEQSSSNGENSAAE